MQIWQSSIKRKQNFEKEVFRLKEITDYEELILRFVYRGGKLFGESIAVAEKMLIIKKGKEFFSVKLSDIEKKEDGGISLSSDFDFDNAKKEGEVWLKGEIGESENLDDELEE